MSKADSFDIGDWPVAILAGGLATRLRPVTENIPKALIEIAGHPFLAHQLRLLQSAGISKGVLLGGYRGDPIEHEFCDRCELGRELKYCYYRTRFLMDR